MTLQQTGDLYPCLSLYHSWNGLKPLQQPWNGSAVKEMDGGTDDHHEKPKQNVSVSVILIQLVLYHNDFIMIGPFLWVRWYAQAQLY